MSKRYAVLENDLVVNVILADDTFIATRGLRAIPHDMAGPGWRWDGVQLVPPPRPSTPPPAPKPQREIDREDALAKLADAASDAGLPPKVRAALAALAKVI